MCQRCWSASPADFTLADGKLPDEEEEEQEETTFGAAISVPPAAAATDETAANSSARKLFDLFGCSLSIVRICVFSIFHICCFVRSNTTTDNDDEKNNKTANDYHHDRVIKLHHHQSCACREQSVFVINSSSVESEVFAVFGGNSVLCVSSSSSSDTSTSTTIVNANYSSTNESMSGVENLKNKNTIRVQMNNNNNSVSSNGTTTTLNMNGGVAPPSGGVSVVKTNFQKPTPPPTLPKTYTPSAASAYRLASLERLAHRQRNLDQNGVSDSPLQTKRELFFMNDLPNATAASSSGTPTTAASVTASIGATPSLATSTLTTVLSKPSTDSAAAASANNLPSSSATVANTAGSLVAANSMPASTVVRSNVNYKDVYSKKITTDKVESLQDAASDNRDKYTAKLADKDKSISQEQHYKELDGYVGFANFPNQVYRKAIKKGFEFTLMVVGESGLGKSTLINSLFLSDLYCDSHVGPSHRIKKTVQVETSQCLLKENGVNLTLTIVDTPGFGDAVDNSNCWQPVIDYIESRYEEYLNAESRVNRKPISDTRVHCCLYFIAPSGHGLKPLDVEFMQRLHDKVNIIPIVSKADTMTPEECAYFKKQIMNEIAQHKIKIYEFPDKTTDSDIKMHKNLRERVPFAVVGSNIVLEVDGKKVRGRKYPWGIAEVENLQHCDFIALRDMMIRTHLQDLKDVTNNVHYENYRCRRLAGLGAECMKSKGLNKNPLAQMEEEKREHELKMKKMEAEMDQVFEAKVKEKKQRLKETEVELQRRHEQMKQSLELQIQELEEKRQQLISEKGQWEQSTGVSLDELRRRSLERDSSLDGKEKKNKKKGLF